nr:PDZ domain-containing protein [Actinomycetota bacterium]
MKTPPEGHQPSYQPPPPPARRRLGGVRTTWLIVGALVAALVIGAAFVLPIPLFYVFEPGPVLDVERLVRVRDGRTYSSEGGLYLTTVGVDVSVTFVDLVRAAVDEHREVILESDYTQGASDQEVLRAARLEMEQSQLNAKEVALSELGLAKPTAGVKVVETVEESPAEGRVAPDDLLLAVDGKPVCGPMDVSTLLADREVGDEVSITIRHRDRKRTFDVATAENPQLPGQPFLGVQLEQLERDFEAGEEIEFKTGRIGGPSAGLLMSLALYDQLTPEDITAGRDIAGTGTIACNGSVGPIGGVGLKVAAAEAKGVDVFLAPVGDFEEAQRVATEIEVVSIATFDDAVRYLEGLK